MPLLAQGSGEFPEQLSPSVYVNDVVGKCRNALGQPPPFDAVQYFPEAVSRQISRNAG